MVPDFCYEKYELIDGIEVLANTTTKGQALLSNQTQDLPKVLQIVLRCISMFFIVLIFDSAELRLLVPMGLSTTFAMSKAGLRTRETSRRQNSPA